ncbi:alpha/beta hydrolase [Actinomadura barringtoniae]|uniref:Alpha/beta hydrolase n=1 Tax=Actinomadura barringtoniae TaxID=1427535 RepID=A0A939P9Y3_9ACTN|nr:alpha/beta hydrolase [Actinomadura barringtoniae]
MVLVHGAFAESASWNRVIERLHGRGLEAVAVANPLRSVAGDAAYLRDVISGIGQPVVLVGHSYGGMVITQAAAGDPAVQSLVYVAAFAPETGESALQLSGKFEGSTLGGALAAYPVTSGGNEFRIADDRYHAQFCADLEAGEAALMAATQRPVTEKALTDGLEPNEAAWRTKPSWFVFGDQDLNIPAELQRYMAERASARGTREIAGASHAIAASQPEAVAASILDAVGGREG